ncbi:MAG: AAA family ATPase [Calditerrivibrio sp.]|nr:AAA family ATPase [Calditerrivibrio sp.]
MLYLSNKYLKYFNTIIKEERFAHGYIFHGQVGIGKKLFAKEIARVTLCQNKSDFNTLCNCKSCVMVNADIHPDLKVYSDEDSSQYGIDQIRDIVEEAYISSYMGGYKFYILDNFHLLRKEACNAFLKTLEEPSEKTVFFLITDQLDRIIPTIRSRCIQLRFNKLTNETLLSILSEKNIDPNISQKVLDISNGSAYMALKHIEYLFDESRGKKRLFIDDFDWNNFSDHVSNIFKITEKEDLRYYLTFLMIKTINIYKKTFNYNYLLLFESLTKMYRMLDYNVNLRILRANILTKIYGVISEKI